MYVLESFSDLVRHMQVNFYLFIITRTPKRVSAVYLVSVFWSAVHF